MANGNGTTADPQKNHTRFIAACVLSLGILCIGGGVFLTWAGYNAELLIGGGTGAISGLLGVLSNRPNQPPPDVTISTTPPAAEIRQQPRAEERDGT